MSERSDELMDFEEDTLKDKYLTFHICKEDYGIEIRHVIEIIGIQDITEVPDTPNYIKGVINLRGKVIPIMDVRLRFGLESREYDERTCVIVVQLDDTNIGLVVDTVSEVATILESSIEPSPKRNSRGGNFIQGMGKIENQIKILLNVHKLLYDEEIEMLSELN